MIDYTLAGVQWCVALLMFKFHSCFARLYCHIFDIQPQFHKRRTKTFIKKWREFLKRMSCRYDSKLLLVSIRLRELCKTMTVKISWFPSIRLKISVQKSPKRIRPNVTTEKEIPSAGYVNYEKFRQQNLACIVISFTRSWYKFGIWGTEHNTSVNRNILTNSVVECVPL